MRTAIVYVGLGVCVAATSGLTRITPHQPERLAAEDLLLVAVDDAQKQAMIAEGEQLYVDFCSGCHLENGRGDVGPTLHSAGSLEDGPETYNRIMTGGEEMPGFSSVLSPEEAYAVGTYVMNSWGNDYGVLSEETAEAQ